MRSLTPPALGLSSLSRQSIVTDQSKERNRRKIDLAGGDINHVPPGLDPPLLRALQGYKHNVAKALIAAGANVHSRIPGGRTALHYAVGRHADIEVVEALISAGAEVNARLGAIEETQSPPLILIAMGSNNENVVEALVLAGADVNATFWDSNDNPIVAIDLLGSTRDDPKERAIEDLLLRHGARSRTAGV